VVFDGCDLDTEVGALDAGSCTLSSTGEAGYLDFGPYVAVPPGTYQVEIAYQAAGDEPLGTWDVATFHQHGETPTVVEEGELAGTGGGVGHVELEWTAANDPTGELTVAEIRTRVDAGASGQLLSIELTRISRTFAPRPARRVASAIVPAPTPVREGERRALAIMGRGDLSEPARTGGGPDRSRSGRPGR
jgi:hypothetical protein